MTQSYHNIEATTAHLSSVGLTFEGFRAWYMMCRSYDPDKPLTSFPSDDVREYIRKHHQL